MVFFFVLGPLQAPCGLGLVITMMMALLMAMLMIKNLLSMCLLITEAGTGFELWLFLYFLICIISCSIPNLWCVINFVSVKFNQFTWQETRMERMMTVMRRRQTQMPINCTSNTSISIPWFQWRLRSFWLKKNLPGVSPFHPPFWEGQRMGALAIP